MKKYSSVVANFASSEASASNYTRKFKFRLHKELTFAAASALICFALIGLPQSARADDALTIASIKSRLSGEQKPFNADQTRQPYADDAALAALNSFAQQIPAAPSSGRQFDDHALAALREFAQRLGADKPQAIKSQLKLAEAGSLLEFLQQGAAPQPSSPKSGPVAGGSKSSRAPVDGHHCRREGLHDLPCDPGCGFRKDADGPDRQDSKRQVRLRELPRSGIGAREGRRRPRRRRHHLVPAGRPGAHGGREQRHLPHLP